MVPAAGEGEESAIRGAIAADSGLLTADCQVSTESSSATVTWRKRACGPSATRLQVR